MPTRLPSLHHPPLGFGHQAAGDPAPGLDQFRLAIDLGASGVAAEVWATADGEAVVHPVGRIGPRFRRRALFEVRSSQIPDGIPTLAALLAEIGDRVAVSLEVADDRTFEAVLTAARAAGATIESNLWLAHAELTMLTSWRHRTSARLINATTYRDLDGGLERRAAELAQRGLDGLLLDHRDWTGGRVAMLHRFGRLAFGRAVIHEREVAALVDTGIDGVYSSHVDRMMAVIAEFYGPV